MRYRVIIYLNNVVLYSKIHPLVNIRVARGFAESLRIQLCGTRYTVTPV